jgi:hypothetical protein
MNKLQMAHDWALKLLEINDGNPDLDYVVAAWSYADAMQAEADERNNKETCDKNIGLDSSVLKPSNSMGLEWQPDWSQAPAWANYIAVYSDHCNASYFEKEPKIISGYTWGGTDGKSLLTPIPVYTGNWQDSLRKRPQ